MAELWILTEENSNISLKQNWKIFAQTEIERIFGKIWILTQFFNWNFIAFIWKKNSQKKFKENANDELWRAAHRRVEWPLLPNPSNWWRCSCTSWHRRAQSGGWSASSPTGSRCASPSPCTFCCQTTHKFKLKFLEIFFFFKFDSLVEDHVVATVTILDPVIDAGRMRFDFADQLDFRAEWGAHQLRFGKHRRLNCTSMLGFNRMFNTPFDSPWRALYKVFWMRFHLNKSFTAKWRSNFVNLRPCKHSDHVGLKT